MVLLPSSSPQWLLASLIFLFGGLAFSIYPLSLSHACDELTSEQVIGANQGLLLGHSLGSMVGPLVASSAIEQLGPQGLFGYFCLCGSGLAIYLLWRRRVRAPVPLADHQAYTAMPPNSPISSELDPRKSEESQE